MLRDPLSRLKSEYEYVKGEVLARRRVQFISNSMRAAIKEGSLTLAEYASLGSVRRHARCPVASHILSAFLRREQDSGAWQEGKPGSRQTRMLAGLGPFESEGHMVEAAIQNLGFFAGVGVLELWERSMKTIATALGFEDRISEEDIHTHHRRRSSSTADGKGSKEGEKDQMASALEEQVIFNATRTDRLLYSHVKAMLLAQMP
eukprot:scaffold910_cov396-Prasinococcus_capsulatus_cf.AAC.4